MVSIVWTRKLSRAYAAQYTFQTLPEYVTVDDHTSYPCGYLQDWSCDQFVLQILKYRFTLLGPYIFLSFSSELGQCSRNIGEVLHESSVIPGQSNKAPDFCY